MIVSEEFIKYFNICNDYIESRWHEKPYKEFYELKNFFLKERSSFEGFDLQIFTKNTVFDYRIGEIFTVTDLEWRTYWRKQKVTDPRWVSTHYHILERYRLFYSTKGGLVKSHIYHIPTNEFKYETESYIRQSKNFEILEKMCGEKFGQKKFKVKRVPPFPHEALEWIKNYFETNNIKPMQLKLEFDGT